MNFEQLWTKHINETKRNMKNWTNTNEELRAFLEHAKVAEFDAHECWECGKVFRGKLAHEGRMLEFVLESEQHFSFHGDAALNQTIKNEKAIVHRVLKGLYKTIDKAYGKERQKQQKEKTTQRAAELSELVEARKEKLLNATVVDVSVNLSGSSLCATIFLNDGRVWEIPAHVIEELLAG